MPLSDVLDRGKNYDRLLAQEMLITEVTECICVFMQEQKISQAELAHRLDKSNEFVSQLLGGGRNLTLRTLADIVKAFEGQVSFSINVSPRGGVGG